MKTESKRWTRRSFAAGLGTAWLGLARGSRVAAQDVLDWSMLSSIEGDLGESITATSYTDRTYSSEHERWTAAEDAPWVWFERESVDNGVWVLSGITTPWNQQTGERLTNVPGYLDETLVPSDLRNAHRVGRPHANQPIHPDAPTDATTFGEVSFERQARDGRPPSDWLLSMDTEELRDWLSTVEIPEAGVHGMTFWSHLTRDHFFRPLLIKGLTEVEQAKLHAAAHHGY